MPQQLFNMCAVSTAKIAAASGQSTSEVGRQVTAAYMRTYQDQHLEEDVSDAANQVSGFIQSVLPPQSLVANLTQIQFCIKHYRTNGKKRLPSLLGGTFFNRMGSPVPDKVKQCVAEVATYHMLVMAGTIPLAPAGWSL